jgi:hypothetical protein
MGVVAGGGTEPEPGTDLVTVGGTEPPTMGGTGYPTMVGIIERREPPGPTPTALDDPDATPGPRRPLRRR